MRFTVAEYNAAISVAIRYNESLGLVNIPCFGPIYKALGVTVFANIKKISQPPALRYHG